MPKQNTALIFNPSSGGGNAERKRAFVESLLRRRGVRYDLYVTESESHLVETAARAVNAYPMIIGAGGDTTFTLIAEQIAGAAQGNTMGVIGLGSVNDLALDLGVPTPDLACDAIAAGHVMDMDLGVVSIPEFESTSCFLGTASLGLGVEVNRFVDEWMSRRPALERFRRIIQIPVSVLGMRRAFRSKAVPLNLQILSGTHVREASCSLLVFNNIGPYAGGFRPSPDASPFDGILDCSVFRAQSLLAFLKTARMSRRTTRKRDAEISVIRSESFTVRSECPVEVQADGEIVGAGEEIFFGLRKGALQVVVHPDRKQT